MIVTGYGRAGHQLSSHWSSRQFSSESEFCALQSRVTMSCLRAALERARVPVAGGGAEELGRGWLGRAGNRRLGLHLLGVGRHRVAAVDGPVL